ncbi:MAG: GH1 family beta-glucosidase [Anaerolineae bacterium]
MITFPKDFVWGTATASYQIEGAVDADGRGVSIWDTFSHTPGKILNGETGDVADDHYHRWQGDVALLRELGVGAYRFSVAWPRILPDGVGRINGAGLDFYDRLVDALLAAGVTPWVTLYHWDLPQALQDRGGWASRDTIEAFVTYTDIVAKRLGDRVKNWMTHNEPWVVAFLGNLLGMHAPGYEDLALALTVAHNVLVSHGRSVPIIRAASQGAQVGIVPNPHAVIPASDAVEDALAAQRFDGFMNRWFLDPLYGRGYPADMLALYGSAAPTIHPGDMEAIAVPTDFLGVNTYSPAFVRADPESPLGFGQLSQDELAARGYELTTMGWPVVPDGMRMLLERLHRDYAPGAMYLAENGAAFPDVVSDGAVHDPRRIAYLDGYLRAAHAAIAAGVPLRGYFVWSFMDNFEWSLGYSQRFGLVYVDYATLERIPKDSATWYRNVIAANGLAGPAS